MNKGKPGFRVAKIYSVNRDIYPVKWRIFESVLMTVRNRTIAAVFRIFVSG
jgi:hypothetical protein